MDPQNQGTRPETQAGPGYPPPVYSQAPAQPLAATQPDVVKRGAAAVIDFVVIGFAVGIINVALGLAMGRFGLLVAGLAGVGAVLVRDVALQGHSLGKKLLGLNVLNAAGGPITPEQSVKRNCTLVLGMLGSAISVIPVLGWLLAMVLYVAGFGLSLYELFLVATGKPRLGDQIAGTHVVAEGQPAIAV